MSNFCRGVLCDDIYLNTRPTRNTEQIIDDFVNSDDPKFAKDSIKQRIKRALGAYKGMHEEVELEEQHLGTWESHSPENFPGLRPEDLYLSKENGKYI